LVSGTFKFALEPTNAFEDLEFSFDAHRARQFCFGY